MAGKPKPLAARFVATVTEPGTYADGDGLYLIVSPTGSRRWSLIFFWQTARKEMGLGKYPAVSLADARDKAVESRRLVALGINPIELRRSARAQAEAEASKTVHTFGMEAEAYIAAHAPSFRNAKHIDQWRSTLSVLRNDKGEWIDGGHCLAIRDLAVDTIGTADIVALLQPIWSTLPETASRVRGRIERVLDAARVAGRREGENPARWRGHLNALLPKRKKLTRGHHAAPPYSGVPAIIGRLREADGVGALALEFLTLCAARTGEVIGATWQEFDLEEKVWTIPPLRMKAGREHRVPLTPRALAILAELAETRTNDFVFPGAKPNRPISNMTMTKALIAAEAGAFTVHGLRSSFRDFCAEETNFAREIAEAALAHVIGDATERAYRRGDALEKRRKLMAVWANYIEPKPQNNVVPINRNPAAA